jgi:hypothetical protein
VARVARLAWRSRWLLCCDIAFMLAALAIAVVALKAA